VAADGQSGWAWDDVLPYFKKHQDQWALEPGRFEPGAFDKIHARGGEWRIEQPRIRWEILDAFRDAAAEAGIPKVDDFNNGDNEGCGYFHVNQKTGVRWNTRQGLFCGRLRPPQPEGGNARRGRTADAGGQSASTASSAPGRCADARCARAARYPVRPGDRHRRRSCNSPASAPGRCLHKLGIAVLHDMRGVGENLQDPPADPLRLQGARRAHHERALPEHPAARGFALEYALTRPRADDHGALPARRLR
jgi:choline dehydrogenase